MGALCGNGEDQGTSPVPTRNDSINSEPMSML